MKEGLFMAKVQIIYNGKTYEGREINSTKNSAMCGYAGQVQADGTAITYLDQVGLVTVHKGSQLGIVEVDNVFLSYDIIRAETLEYFKNKELLFAFEKKIDNNKMIVFSKMQIDETNVDDFIRNSSCNTQPKKNKIPTTSVGLVCRATTRFLKWAENNSSCIDELTMTEAEYNEFVDLATSISDIKSLNNGNFAEFAISCNDLDVTNPYRRKAYDIIFKLNNRSDLIKAELKTSLKTINKACGKSGTSNTNFFVHRIIKATNV